MLVKDVMTEHVICVSPDDNAVAVGNLLVKERISGAVVMVGGDVRGMISKESFLSSVRYIGTRRLDTFKVRDLMSEKVDIAKPDEDIDSLVDRILNATYRIDRFPVVDDGKLIGIISKGDITKIFAEQMQGGFKVRDIMQYDPIVVYEYTPLSEVIQNLGLSGEKRVIVKVGERVEGIITVLDLSLRLFNMKKELKDMDIIPLLSLDEIITRNPITIEKDKDSADAARIMVDKKIGGLPVINKKLDGLITKTDIVKAYKLCSS